MSDTNSPCCDTTDAACPGNASSLDPTDPLYREEPESPICPAGTAQGTALVFRSGGRRNYVVISQSQDPT